MSFRPRRNDHLVEPLFDGLGARHTPLRRAHLLALFVATILAGGLLVWLR